MSDLINASENFKGLKDSKTALRVFTAGNFLSGIDFDDMQVTFPSSTTELYTYYLASVSQVAIRVTYSTSAKTSLIRVEKIDAV